MADPTTTSEMVLCRATGRDEAQEAVSWLAEGHPLREEANRREVLRALVSHNGGGDTRTAIERVTREILSSKLDTAAVLFALDQARSPGHFRRSLDVLAWKSPSGTLDGLTNASILAAQRSDPGVMSTLCAVAGISSTKLADWAETDLPDSGDPDWSMDQVKAAMSVLNPIVEGHEETSLPSATPLRALELLFGEDGAPRGWGAVEQMRRGGVPYEVLLAQREAGGSWLAHRNRTSGQVSTVLAEELCERLDDRGVDYLRASSMGGPVSASEIERLSGTRSVGLVARDDAGKAVAAVAFSVARDGGTARSSGSRLLKLRNSRLPVLLLLAGPGWAERNESADLTLAFSGEVYTDESIDELADQLARRSGAPHIEP